MLSALAVAALPIAAGGASAEIRFRHHYIDAAAYDGRTMRLYKDGKQVGSLPKKGTIAVGPAVAACLADTPPTPGGRPLIGQLDDARIHRRALTPAQVAALATQRWTPPTPRATWRHQLPKNSMVIPMARR